MNLSTGGNEPAIIVKDLSFRYADAQRWVLRAISFSVGQGETLLLLGPSGSGKSTLALCLNGLIPQQIEGEMQGEVRVTAPLPPDAGQQPAGAPRLGGGGAEAFVGEVFQDPETQMVMPRVDEEVAFGLENFAVPQAEMPPRIAAALALAGLQDKARAWVDNLSGGQKQRLALAAVLALQPAILVLDEPTANLDPAATRTFFQNLARLKAELGITIVLIEHRLDAVLPLVDRVLALGRDGQVLAQGTPQKVFSGQGAALEAEGVWLPMTCRLTSALRAAGLALDDCPLSLDGLAAELRAARLWSATTPSLPKPDATTEASRSIDARSMAAISIENLSFAYPDSPPVLRDVTMSVERGAFFALVGANGSGKTTLAKHMVGLLRPASGSIMLLGQDTRRQSTGDLARQAGYVFQNPEHQFVTERVADELAYSLRGRWSDDEIARRVQDLLQRFGLQGYADENPFALSQGQKRRLSVATMVALEQPILILDEPTFGQDQQSTAALMGTLQALHAAGTTILFVTHDMQLVAEYASRVAVMDAGQVIFAGAPRELFGRADILQRASLTLPPLADLSQRLGLPPLLTVDEWVEAASAAGRASRSSHA